LAINSVKSLFIKGLLSFQYPLLSSCICDIHANKIIIIKRKGDGTMLKGVTFIVLILFSVAILSENVYAASTVKPGSQQEEGEAEEMAGMIADCLVLRPLGLVGTVLGTAFFIVSIPFSALGGNVGAAFRTMVIKPAKFTFGRPLGIPPEE
jgi:preprotein translocase subunit SecG